MMAGGRERSACASSGRLRVFSEWPINDEGTGEFERASPLNAIIRTELVMTCPKIARPRRARKWYTAYSQRKNSFYNLNDRSRLGFEVWL
jgi:hypothetical protein